MVIFHLICKYAFQDHSRKWPAVVYKYYISKLAGRGAVPVFNHAGVMADHTVDTLLFSDG